MRRMNRNQIVGIAALVGAVAVSLAALFDTPTLAQTEAPQVQGAQQAQGAEPRPEPVEEDMHEYMEYVNQPTYRALRKAMKEKPNNDAGWLAIKSGALILSESGNLVMLRGPESDRSDWLAHAAAVRDKGAEMYRAAHDKKFEEADRHYRQLLNQCNACHQQFAGGEHQLEP